MGFLAVAPFYGGFFSPILGPACNKTYTSATIIEKNVFLSGVVNTLSVVPIPIKHKVISKSKVELLVAKKITLSFSPSKKTNNGHATPPIPPIIVSPISLTAEVDISKKFASAISRT